MKDKINHIIEEINPLKSRLIKLASELTQYKVGAANDLDKIIFRLESFQKKHFKRK